MGAIENHEALMYGYRLGGPADNWVGLTNELVRYTDGSPFLLPRVPWETEAMREENHSDHFAAAAEEVLAANGLGSLFLRTYSLGWEEEGHILAAVVHEPESGPLTLDPASMSAASQYDESLKRALSVLELRTCASKPEWIMASYYA
ncbi:hypothetical protein [Streptomyces lavendulae]|uniref:hypothetical protein n=1 Tax=Streptomyces lavendulae TaxID=1914 RepID=UPI00249FB0F6|nr:hypothetical protein [Streptomyces lavendulae]GLX22575.1 hypothetical protein Slala01_62190 [Streptomyces lavendulae subsp. lavendulae]GLX30058.1 hypothetical protein Slala02_58780 [Streptomyces lavendulae subsp. lavendulae]